MSHHWPYWWDWEIELSGHIEKRMLQRGFSEAELRTMLDDVLEIAPTREDGRWQVICRFEGTRWKIILEPREVHQTIEAITAFPLDG